MPKSSRNANPKVCDSDDVVVTVRSERLGEEILEKHRGRKVQYVVVENISCAGAMDKVFTAHGDLDYVLHTASPFTQKWTDAVKEVLDPAIQGTIETLRSIQAHAPSVKRVVILSSFVTLMNPSGGVQVYDESMWNPVTWEASVANPRLTYTGSKTLAEKAAWDFVAREHPKFDLVSLNPPLVFGPIAHKISSLDRLNTSNQRILGMVQGAFRDNGLPPTGVYLWVDVRDVALAHILAMESANAGGQRFMLVGGHFSNKSLAAAIAERHPDLASKLPEDTVDDTPADVYGYDGTRTAKSLAMEFRSFRDCIGDTVASLQKAGA
ncbi:MAG: hypothetical protein Q9169_006454 [Polycauliona sp. 2 TL-2023]